MKPLLGLLAMFAAAAVDGCASPSHEVSATPPPVNAPSNAPYRLTNGERLRVIVFGQADLSNTYSVDGSGVVAMPLAGRVRAQGLTTAEVERAIEARLRQGYLREPSVSVEVECFGLSSFSARSASPGSIRSSAA